MRVGFSINADEDNKGYSEALFVFTICYVMHYYPQLTKDKVMDLTQSQVSYLIEMAGAIQNPSVLDKYKTLKFKSEFEFEHYIIDKFKVI